MSYHQFKDEEGEGYGSVEVFYNDGADADFTDDDGTPYETGWYWWPCFPGCLPDSMPCGPFATELEALNDAQQS